MIYQEDYIQSPSSQSSVPDNESRGEAMRARKEISLQLCRDNTCETRQNNNSLGTPQQQHPDNSFLKTHRHPYRAVEEFGNALKNPMRAGEALSHSLNIIDARPVSNDFELPSWTVRNSEGYQQELLRQSYGSSFGNESQAGLIASEDHSTKNSPYYGWDSMDECILIHLLLSFPEDVNDDVWNCIQSSLKVSQSVAEQELMLPISRTSFLCHQRSEEITTSDSRLVREISAYLAIKRCLRASPTRYLFQLFLLVSEKKAQSNLTQCFWNNLNVVAFIQFPATGQLLLPIERELNRKHGLASTEGFFVGSFFMQDRKIHHHIPNESSLRRQAFSQNSYGASDAINSGMEEVIVVDRNDIVLEPNGARAGRPSHRETGQLLMTISQVKKVLEIRNRWKGLSPRQRRDNVTSADFYTFLTLNRDETAECLGVCATWLKDAIRSQGVHVWPGRPLRRTGAMLQTLKESLESTRAALRFSDPAIGQTTRYEAEIHRYENEIRDLLSMRVEIVRANVSPEYFDRFTKEDGEQYLDPDWNALPPKASQKYNI